MLASFALLAFFGDFNLLTFIRNNPLKFIAMVLLYVLLGTVWSFTKWYIYCKGRARKYNEIKKNWKKSGEKPGEWSESELKLFYSVITIKQF